MQRWGLLPVLLGVGMLAACGREGDPDAGPQGLGGTAAPLPGPVSAAPGGVTGMPAPRDQPEPVEPVPAITSATPAAPLPVESPPVSEPTIEPGGPSPAPVAPAGVDLDAAASTVTEYFASLGAGAFGRAQLMWSTTPTDGAVTQLARGRSFDANVGAPAAASDSVAAPSALVPAEVHATFDDGTTRRVSVTYTVRRNPAGEWRIASATAREVTP